MRTCSQLRNPVKISPMLTQSTLAYTPVMKKRYMGDVSFKGRLVHMFVVEGHVEGRLVERLWDSN